MVKLDPNIAFNTGFKTIVPTNAATISTYNTTKLAAAFKKCI